jgi:transcriptional regulator with XRE-family HTH domain
VNSGRVFLDEVSAPFRQAFGRRLQALRSAAGLTQKELAEKARCKLPMIGRYERGEHFPKIEVLLRLRKALNVSLDYLVTGLPESELRDIRLLARLRLLDQLPPDRQAELVRLLDVFLGKLAPAGEAAGRVPGGGR